MRSFDRSWCLAFPKFVKWQPESPGAELAILSEIDITLALLFGTSRWQQEVIETSYESNFSWEGSGTAGQGLTASQGATVHATPT